MCYEAMKLCTGSIYDSNGWYLVILSQYEALPVGNWWYWDTICHYLLVLGGFGSVHNVYFVKYDVTVSFLAQLLDTVTYFVSQVLDTAS